VLVESPDAGRIAALLDGRVEQRDGARLVVRHADAAALNQQLVREGARVASIGPQHRTLEDVVLEVTGAGNDQVGADEGPAVAETGGGPAGTGVRR
jgi:hypothetical protein